MLEELPDDDAIVAEVERRLRELRQDPDEMLRRFDRDGDGVLDKKEWRVARAVLRREAQKSLTDERVGDYRIVAPIGRGAQGHTRLAVHEPSGDFVALKELDFMGLSNWDAIDTFEREAAVLGGLDHRAIPQIRETFRLEEDGNLRLLMAQEFVEGDNLEVMLRRGTLFDEARLVRFAGQLLEVLEYLHGHSPPVVHRDIKPANVIARPDGQIALVDFGAAQGDGLDERIIGTTGYMPPEQLMGRAAPASDIYALGATLIHLATRKHPSDLGNGIELVWTKYAKLSDAFERWLDRCVEPMAEDRFSTARVARDSLARILGETEAPLTTQALVDFATADNRPARWEPVPGRPPNSSITARRMGGKLDVNLSRVQNKAFVLSSIVAFIVIGAAILLRVVGATISFGLELMLWATGLGTMAYSFWSTSVHSVSGDDRGLTLDSKTAKLLPLEAIDGPTISSTRNGSRVYVAMKDGHHHLIAVTNQDDGRYLRDALQAWLVERRMELQ